MHHAYNMKDAYVYLIKTLFTDVNYRNGFNRYRPLHVLAFAIKTDHRSRSTNCSTKSETSMTSRHQDVDLQDRT